MKTMLFVPFYPRFDLPPFIFFCPEIFALDRRSFYLSFSQQDVTPQLNFGATNMIIAPNY